MNDSTAFKTRLPPWLAAAGVSLTLAAASAMASDYPAKPIELIVQFPAGSSADVVAVRKDSPWNNLSDMMAHARAKPGEIRLGNSGIGSHTHISAEAFMVGQKGEVLHVPFAAAQVVTSLLGGHIDALVQLPGALAPHVRAGTLKIIGTLSSTREPAFPTVPTALEQGMKFQADFWRGVAAPKGTPPEVLAKLEAALQKAVTGPEFKAAGEKNGFLPAYQPGRAFAQTIATDDAALAQLMAKVGLKLQ